MVSFKTFLISLPLVANVLAHTIPGIDSIQKQLVARDDVNGIFDDLPAKDIDFINLHLKELTSFNGSSCGKCKNKIKYGQGLLNAYPEQNHLVSLLLFKYCIVSNNNTVSKCENNDFFITTNSKNSNKFTDKFDSGLTSSTSIDFFDNDFLHMLQNFNISSDLDLDYYCYYKSSQSCSIPTPNVDELFDIEKWWPQKSEIHFSQPKYNSTRDTFNVVHFTDFHLQLRYELGSESNCSTPMCCLPESVNKDLRSKDYNFDQYFKHFGSKSEEYSFYPDANYDENNEYHTGEYYDFPKYRGVNFNSAPATAFGGYLCDSPELLLNNSLAYISQAHKDKDFEFSIFTGDLVDHDVIHCDAETTKNAELRNFELMKTYLDHIPIYPSLGNHDTFPYGQLSPLKYDFNNSYDGNNELMIEVWVNNGWLPESERDVVKNHYSGFAVTTKRNLKVISLNSNCYYQKNLWSYINLSTDPDLFGQWEFLVNELIESEQNNQRVWIMAHIPVADYDALPFQAQIFGKIVERFSPYTIANIFYGHTHRDQFHVLYASNSSKDAENVVNMAWVAQSITPLTNNNPSWRYYEVEDESFDIINSYNYYTELNQTFTNNGAEPEWKFEYSARDTFDPSGEWPIKAPINATFWQKYVVDNLKNESNIEFNQLYSSLQYRHSPLVPNCTNGTKISSRCWNENYCNAGNFLSWDYNKCQRK